MPALKDADEVSQFLSRGNRFVFDSVRDSGTSDLCRKGPNGELECVKVPLASMALFALMGVRARPSLVPLQSHAARRSAGCSAQISPAIQRTQRSVRPG